MRKKQQLPPKSSDADFVVVGKIGTPFGIKGWVKIHSFTEVLEQILDYDPWYLEDEAGWRPIKLIDGQKHGKGVIAKLADFDTPEQSRLLTGSKIGIKRSQLAPLSKDEYYWRDLEGLTVINYDGKVLGKIIYLLETGSNDVMVVKDEKEYAIPYLRGEVVISIDLEKREMHVKWDEPI